MSKGREIARVRWGSLKSEASLYGTALTLEPSGAVHLVNPLMPSWTLLQEWYSSTDYQSLRDAPTLPLLRPGRAYRIDADIASTPADSVVFEVRCFDRFDDLLRTEVLHPPRYDFEYPADCHHYAIRLMSGGCDELRFGSFALLEVGDRDEQ